MNEKISRRTAIKCIGGSAIGLAGLAGLWKREELLAFFERDKRAAEQEPERALQVDTRLTNRMVHSFQCLALAPCACQRM